MSNDRKRQPEDNLAPSSKASLEEIRHDLLDDDKRYRRENPYEQFRTKPLSGRRNEFLFILSLLTISALFFYYLQKLNSINNRLLIMQDTNQIMEFNKAIENLDKNVENLREDILDIKTNLDKHLKLVETQSKVLQIDRKTDADFPP